eukprot:TRINITY_DN8786_c0_g1_i4.p1 TRINITY_DN8786_c0_g1~~TRINITY_DN8786_c0_g1_i4.p1  ORF type:complete len:147 (+),score=22.83 TRINITY_DN8786_c0_g1_i4:80-520(+)
MAEPKIDKIKATFALYDRKGDGTIAIEDFPTVYRALGRTPTELEVKELVTKVDPKGKGRVTLSQLQAVWEQTKPAQITKTQLKEGFKVCDEENTGFVSADELRKILGEMGDTLSKDEIDKLMKHVKVDKSGRFNIEEFLTFITAPA